jgi:hypothetical protein
MFSISTFVAFFVSAAPFLVRAIVVPTIPAPGAVYNEGSPCPIAWDGDVNSTTDWKNMDIALMSGNNYEMEFITSNYLLLSKLFPWLIYSLPSRRYEFRWYRQRYIQLPMSQCHTQLRHLLLSIRCSCCNKRFLGWDWAIRYRFDHRCNHTTCEFNSTQR